VPADADPRWPKEALGFGEIKEMTILPPGADLVALYNEGTNMKAMNVCRA